MGWLLRGGEGTGCEEKVRGKRQVEEKDALGFYVERAGWERPANPTDRGASLKALGLSGTERERGGFKGTQLFVRDLDGRC